MSLRIAIMCDRCKEEVGAYNEKPWQLRKRLREVGWVRANRDRNIAYEGPLDFCNVCAEQLKEVTT